MENLKQSAISCKFPIKLSTKSKPFSTSAMKAKILLTQPQANMIFNCFIILYMFIEWFILLHDLYSFLALPMYRSIFARRTATCAAAPPRTGTHVASPCRVENGPGKKRSLGVNPKVVMERLGTFWDPDDNRLSLGSKEMEHMFVEDEPSVEEVKEAFGVFDKNGDGYIDAKELQNVLSKMGFLELSESNCRKMIVAYDVDKDGKISFREFLKVVEDGFQ